MERLEDRKRKERRAARGDGQFRQRADGRWEWRGRIGGRRISIYGLTESDCRQKRDRRRRELDLASAQDRSTVAGLMNEWLAAVRPKVRPRTYELYESIARLHIIPELGETRLGELTAARVEQLRDKKLRAGLSPSTIMHIRTVLKSALKRALKQGRVATNAAALSEPPQRKMTRELRALTAEEADQFLSACSQSRFGPLFSLAVATGLRRGELCGLKWTDIDWKKKTLSVGRQVQRIPRADPIEIELPDGSRQRIKSKLTETELKSRASRRTIPLSAVALAALRRQQELQEEDRAVAGEKWADEGWVFSTHTGRVLEPRNVTRAFKAAMKAAKLASLGVRLHDLRRTFVALLKRSRVPLEVARDLLGHSSIVLTAETYGSVIPESMDKAVAAVDRLLKKVAKKGDKNEQGEPAATGGVGTAAKRARSVGR